VERVATPIRSFLSHLHHCRGGAAGGAGAGEGAWKSPVLPFSKRCSTSGDAIRTRWHAAVPATPMPFNRRTRSMIISLPSADIGSVSNDNCVF
jgi:hypothetical protein